MTENKRYRKVMGLIKNTDGETFDLTEIENLLNEQEEQIKKLKQKNKMLKNNINKLTEDIEYLKTLPSQHRELYKQSEIKRIDLSIENNMLKEQLKNDDNFNFKYTKDFERIAL